MEAIRLHKVVEKDGEISMSGLPCKKGQQVEMILLMESSDTPKQHLTADALHGSELIGLWKDREDIGESSDFARELRNQAQNR